MAGISLKALVEAGLPAGAAVRAILDVEEGGILAWANKRNVSYTSLSSLLRGTARKPYMRERMALTRRFGVDLEWLGKNL